MIGTRLNNYEIVSLLGEGGMGMVYLARHPYMGRRAAVKVLRPELLHDKSLVARFMEEARATNAIQHPNIIDIIDVGLLPETQTPYLMMEFLDGESLAHRLQASRILSARDAVDIACQTAAALAAAHACHIIHRDLKPDNLYLLADPSLPSGSRVKVLDFGIAKLRGDMRARSAQTKSGILMGTPFYMSPEQCRGFAAGLDHRSDIYSLGIIVYEMLCGQLPFVSDGVGDLLVRHITEPPASLRTKVPTIPESLDGVVLRALAKDPADRFESMSAFAQALRDCEPGIESADSTKARIQLGLAMARTDAAGMPAPAEAIVVTPGRMATRIPTAPQTTLSSMAGQLKVEGAKRRLGKRQIVFGVPILGVLILGGALAILFARPKSPPLATPAVHVAPALLPTASTETPAAALAQPEVPVSSSPTPEEGPLVGKANERSNAVRPRVMVKKETRRQRSVSSSPTPVSPLTLPVVPSPNPPPTSAQPGVPQGGTVIPSPSPPDPATNSTSKWGGRL